MSSTVTLNIDISDINDNPPVFNPPNSTAVLQVRLIVCLCVLMFGCFCAHRCISTLLSLFFKLNQAAGTTLLKLSVSDKDSQRNGPPFEFRIMSGNEGNFFSLDQTGTLRTNRVFGPEAPREFTLEIQVNNQSILSYLYSGNVWKDTLLVWLHTVPHTVCQFLLRYCSLEFCRVAL